MAYSFSELEQLWRGAGGPADQAQTAAAVALAESRGNPRASNRDSNGTIDRGLWEINSVHGYPASQLLNPRGNARAAVEVWHGSGWGAWSTYNSGAYLTYLPRSSSSSSAGTRPRPSGGGGVLGSLEGAAGDVAGAVVGGPLTAAGDVLGIFGGAASAGLGFMKAALWLVSPLNWLRAVETLLGFALILIGLALAARADDALEQVGGTAAGIATRAAAGGA